MREIQEEYTQIIIVFLCRFFLSCAILIVKAAGGTSIVPVVKATEPLFTALLR